MQLFTRHILGCELQDKNLILHFAFSIGIEKVIYFEFGRSFEFLSKRTKHLQSLNGYLSASHVKLYPDQFPRRAILS
jgi:hypothetical protein